MLRVSLLYGALLRLSRGDVLGGRTEKQGDGLESQGAAERPIRADAQRNLDLLLQAAKEVFATSGVDATVREIAEKAGLGMGTLYRHFPQRSDLIAAVFRREIDACADAASALSLEHEPFAALTKWLRRYSDFIATKRGLAPALYSGDPAYENLAPYFQDRLRPALQTLLTTAAAASEIRSDVNADDLLKAVAALCLNDRENSPDFSNRMIGLIIAGLRYRDNSPI